MAKTIKFPTTESGWALVNELAFAGVIARSPHGKLVVTGKLAIDYHCDEVPIEVLHKHYKENCFTIPVTLIRPQLRVPTPHCRQGIIPDSPRRPWLTRRDL